ncbi:gliding motility-associated ABC transporter substrate-binding protein GldG [Candidatus Sulfidibacterium hydrothermale]|uniref:gliding motility-associated ABC transporter substrate-binding protein GldG n=1 Tax=Candidatus Sulfidibacterium hydrothermale TaxID=2875962 RepID=UPI001F0A557F|nr:gliding motility-associated ABC transporter substrate-binding protein GldG [Candidatus Sulfidibacterium hydrothermale]UBM63254.1 gliding motility-associated ABC transporter substrate-binding protein GldG [Candidatus Sulfidibacterium hydrothermale]
MKKKVQLPGKKIERRYRRRFLWVIILIIAANWLGSFYFTRIDLTTDKRFTLADVSKQILKKLDDPLTITVYLKGKFPPGFQRLAVETREMLEELQAYQRQVRFRFVNPSKSSDPKKRVAFYRQLMDKGLIPTNLQVKTKNGMEQQTIFPGALLQYHDREIAVSLLSNERNIPPDQVLNHSIENLEFVFVNAIHQLEQIKKPAVAYLIGQGEPRGKRVTDIMNTLHENYDLKFVRIDTIPNALLQKRKGSILPRYRALIIAKPQKPFSEKEKLMIDQYIMYGGKVLWLIDPVLASMDSIKMAETTVSIDLNLGLQEMLFTYGVRLNKDLLLDLNAVPIPVRTGEIGGQAQVQLLPWYYYLLVTPRSKNPVVRNLNSIEMDFASSIDTLSVKGIKKTVLLKTSPYCGVEKVPGIISLAILRAKPSPQFFRGPARFVAVLLSGKFPSDFQNRLVSGLKSKLFPFKKQSVPTQMIVVSDGDVLLSQLKIPDGYSLPLGYNQFTRQTYGNKDFILNALNELTDGPGLIALRTREFKLRLLDKTKVNNQALQWQLINVAGPLLMILLFAFAFTVWRKRKYGRKKAGQ